MSQETMEWLNTMTLIGNTDHRRNAWHYREELQGDEPNHYPGPVPTEDIRRRLIPWEAVPRRVAVELPADIETMTHMNDKGEPLRWAVMEERQAITRSDTGHVFEIFKGGYRAHQYDQWLIKNVETILSDGLQINSAGLLKGGGVMWVEVGVPDTIVTPEGVEFLPNLLAATSFDGSLATTYKRTIQAVVCDNTLEVAKAEKGNQIKIRHSVNSIGRIGDVREALAIVHTAADDFAAEVALLTQQTVTDKQWSQLLEQIIPIDREKDGVRKVNMAERKREEVNQMYRHDSRSNTWVGTAFGALQAFNTWGHHVQGGLSGKTTEERTAARAQRNMLRAVEGTGAKQDQVVLDALSLVLAS